MVFLVVIMCIIVVFDDVKVNVCSVYFMMWVVVVFVSG